jgi:hypothetical protein
MDSNPPNPTFHQAGLIIDLQTDLTDSSRWNMLGRAGRVGGSSCCKQKSPCIRQM